MRKAVCALLVLSAGIGARGAAETPEPNAVAIAHRMMQAMGGEAAWKHAHYIRFDFIVKIGGEEKIARSHLWDKQTGRCRLEDKNGTGEPGVVLFNVTDHQGSAYVAGKKLEGMAAISALNAAYHTYSADLDWLALPWRWLDPDVHLNYTGRKTVDSHTFDVVEVTVDQVGGAPGNRYNAYVSTESHLMEKWEIVGGDQSLWNWQYATVGGIKLASDHTGKRKDASISMGKVQVLDKLDDAFLSDPAHWLEKLK